MALTSRIPRIMARAAAGAQAVNVATGEKIVASAKARVPRDTGALHDAIHVEVENDGVRVVAGDDQAFYGALVEFGTRYRPPTPFLEPAAAEHRAPHAAAIRALYR